MLGSLKKTKRRTVQKVLHSQGKAEYTLHDPEYDLAVQRFFALERQLASILARMKDSRRVTDRYVTVNAALGSYLAIPFSTPEAIQGTDEMDGEGDSVGGRKAEAHDAFRLANCLTKSNDVVGRSCAAVVQHQCIEELEAVLQNAFPGRKKLISSHAGLLMDVESYRRRIKALQDKGKEGNDKTFMKLTRKLENAQMEYNTKHRELLADLNKLYFDRFKYLEPIYAAFMASQLELHGFLASSIASFAGEDGSASDLIRNARATIQEYIQQNGPPKEIPKPKEKLFSRLHTWHAHKQAEGSMTAQQDPASMPAMPMADQFSPPSARQSVGSGVSSARYSQDVTSPTNMSYNDASSPGFQGNNRLSQVHYPASEASHEPLSATSQATFHGQTSPVYSDASSPYGGNSPSSLNNGARPVTVDRLSEASLTSPQHNGYEENDDEDEATSDGGASPQRASPKSVPAIGSPSAHGEEDIPEANDDVHAAQQDQSQHDGSEDEFVIAAFPFSGTDEEDLQFKKGDIIRVLEKVDEGWWRGELNGTSGLFPVTYVQQYNS